MPLYEFSCPNPACRDRLADPEHRPRRFEVLRRLDDRLLPHRCSACGFLCNQTVTAAEYRMVGRTRNIGRVKIAPVEKVLNSDHYKQGSG